MADEAPCQAETPETEAPKASNDGFLVPALPAPGISPPKPPVFQEPSKMADEAPCQAETPETEAPKTSSDGFLVPALPGSGISPPKPPVVSKAPSSVPAPPLKYQEPAWSSAPPQPSAAPNEVLDEAKLDFYYLEVLKTGKIIDKIALDKPFMVFGRLDACDVLCEHPTLSRYHAVLQYSDGLKDPAFAKGYYIYDLNSTHGTFLNKAKVEPYKYSKVGADSLIKFGQSTRLYIMHGPVELEENMSRLSEDLNINLTHEQMKKLKEKQAQLALRLRVKKELEEEEALQKERQEMGEFDWGMKSDPFFNKDGQDEEAENAGIEALEADDESYYSSDPKRALKTFFDREGDELEYDVEELSTGKFKCRIRLPILNDAGEYMVAEVTQEGKKKECMASCALEACRILHAEGVLKTGTGSNKRGKSAKDWESMDYYDSDEDTYLDRTGEIERKRLSRMAKASNADPRRTHTFDSLKQDIRALLAEQNDIDKRLELCKHVTKAVEEDDIDQYISSIKANSQFNIDTVTRAKMKRRKLEIVNELRRFDKLMSAAKPADFDYAKWKEQILAAFSVSADQQQKVETSATKLDIAAGTSTMVRAPRASESAVKEPEVKKISNSESTQEPTPDDKPTASTTPHMSSEKKKPAPRIPEEPRAESQSKKPKIAKRQQDEPEMAEEDSEKYYSKLSSSDYDTWVPPKDQSGDGRTKLNDKYGY